MDVKNINAAGKNQQFFLTIDPNLGIPCWITMKDEVWLRVAGYQLYKWAQSHTGVSRNSNVTDDKSYAINISKTIFSSGILPSEASLLKDLSLGLSSSLKASDKVYICYFSELNNNHFISLMFDNGNVVIGGHFTDEK